MTAAKEQTAKVAAIPRLAPRARIVQTSDGKLHGNIIAETTSSVNGRDRFSDLSAEAWTLKGVDQAMRENLDGCHAGSADTNAMLAEWSRVLAAVDQTGK